MMHQTLDEVVEDAMAAVGEEDALREAIRLVVEELPCAKDPPADPAVRRKWAVAGLYRMLEWFPFYDEDGTEVRKLAPYQEEMWADRWETAGENRPDGLARLRYIIKSQKIGVSIECLLECIHVALSPRCWGREVIIGAQNQVKAEEHLKNLKDMLRRSPFAPLLIERMPRSRRGRLMRDALSRSNVAALMDPSNPDARPTRIWAVGITSPGLLLSNTSVEHVHLSDVTIATATPTQLDRAIAQVRSRIVKSRGTMVVEAPPGPPAGTVYEQYRDACRALSARVGEQVTRLPPGEAVDTEWARFRRIPWKVAVDAGVLARETLERERHEINNDYEFARLYNADFLSGSLVAYPDAVRRHGALEAERLLEGMAAVPGGA